MTYITETPPSSYTVRHSDWLKTEPWRATADYAGQIAAKTFYVKQEAKCKAIDTTFPMDIWINPLTWIQDWLIAREKQHYAETVTLTYDDAALQIVKTAEQILSFVNSVQTALQNAIATAKTELNNIITPLANQVKTQLQPAVTAAQNAIAQAQNSIAAIQTKVNQASTDATNAFNNARTAINNVAQVNQDLAAAKTTINNIIADVNAKATTINSILVDVNAKAKQITALQSQASDAVAKINSAVSTLNTHTNQINDLYAKLKATPTPAPTTTQTKRSFFGVEF